MTKCLRWVFDTLSTHCQSKVFRAKKVRISILTPLYRTIKISLLLLEAKITLADSTTLSYYTNTILIYYKPWWCDIGLSVEFISLNGPVSFSFDTSVEADSQYSITCFFVGALNENGLSCPRSKDGKLFWTMLL